MLLITITISSSVVANQDHPSPTDLEALPYVSPQPRPQTAGSDLRVDSLWNPERSVTFFGRKYNIVVFVNNGSGDITTKDQVDVLNSMERGTEYWRRHAALFNAYYSLDYEVHTITISPSVLDYPCGVRKEFMVEILDALGVDTSNEDVWWRMDEHIRQTVSRINTTLPAGEYPVTDATFIFVFGDSNDSDRRFASSSGRNKTLACAYLAGPSSHMTLKGAKYALIHAHEDVHAKAGGPDRYASAHAPCNFRPLYLAGPGGSYFNHGSLFRSGDEEMDRPCLEDNPWLGTDIMAKPWTAFDRSMNLPESEWTREMFTPEYEWFNGYADEEFPDGIPDSLGTVQTEISTNAVSSTVSFTVTRTPYLPQNPIVNPQEDMGYFLPEGIVLFVSGLPDPFPVSWEDLEFQPDSTGRPQQMITGSINPQRFYAEHPKLINYQLELGVQLYGMLKPVPVTLLNSGDIYAPPQYDVYLPLVVR